jgi:hypothetical protein
MKLRDKRTPIQLPAEGDPLWRVVIDGQHRIAESFPTLPEETRSVFDGLFTHDERILQEQVARAERCAAGHSFATEYTLDKLSE